VSGRSIAELDRLFVPLHLAIAGQHGAELRHADGKTEVDRPRIAAVATARGALAALASQNHGLYFEDKGAALAVHYRRVPQLGPLVERTLQDVARRSGGEFAMQTGKMVRELVPHGKNKGGAIAEFMREPPFAGRIPVFLGDDMTDEDGFALVGKIAGPRDQGGAWREHCAAPDRRRARGAALALGVRRLARDARELSALRAGR
jgi:trehalose 6-phosphate phosphatase